MLKLLLQIGTATIVSAFQEVHRASWAASLPLAASVSWTRQLRRANCQPQSIVGTSLARLPPVWSRNQLFCGPPLLVELRGFQDSLPPVQPQMHPQALKLRLHFFNMNCYLVVPTQFSQYQVATSVADELSQHGIAKLQFLEQPLEVGPKQPGAKDSFGLFSKF